MTKTWCPVLAAVLALTAVPLHAAEPPEFLNLPPTEIKVAPLPLDTKTPLSTPSDSNPLLSIPNSTYGPACRPYYTAYTPCPPTPCCDSWLSGLGTRLRSLELGNRDHPCLEKFKDWITYRPCHLTPLECCYRRPVPDNYTYFLYLGCHESNCGGCTSCGSCGK